jgi:4-amino-4-deoxy-L-arabinose transferase-like glycosyltransferase
MRFLLLVLIWFLAFFTFFTFITTKFHHYIFPAVVPAALLTGYFLDGIVASTKRVAIAAVLFMVVVMAAMARDLALEPWQLVDLFTYHYKNYKPDYYFPKDLKWHPLMGVVSAVAVALVLLGSLADGWAARRAEGTKNDPAPFVLRLVEPLLDGLALLQNAAAAALGGHRGGRNAGLVAFSLVGGLMIGLFMAQVYMPRMSQHWSQRYLFDTYEENRQPGEPILAYQMNWRGETFYAANQDAQIRDNKKLKEEIAKPGRKFILTETKRFKGLKSAVGKDFSDKLKIINRSNTKWYLVLLE